VAGRRWKGRRRRDCRPGGGGPRRAMKGDEGESEGCSGLVTKPSFIVSLMPNWALLHISVGGSIKSFVSSATTSQFYYRAHLLFSILYGCLI
jgi:hypothetical protein